MAQTCDAKGWPFARVLRLIGRAGIEAQQLLSPFSRWRRRFAGYLARLASLRALRRLSDRELRDMGIERHQIGACVDVLQRRSEEGAWRRYHPWRSHDRR